MSSEINQKGVKLQELADIICDILADIPNIEQVEHYAVDGIRMSKNGEERISKFLDNELKVITRNDSFFIKISRTPSNKDLERTLISTFIKD